MVKWIGTLEKTIFQKNCTGYCIVLVQLSAVPIFALHPYYSVYYNLCWKIVEIPKIISVGESSGLELAAKYQTRKKMQRR